MVSIEFFFDCSSPWTYFAFEGINRMAGEVEMDLRWKPILVGGVFNQVNPSVYLSRDNPVPAKEDYRAKDLKDWAGRLGVTIVWRPTVFPVNSVKAMRGCLVADAEGRLVEHARATFEAYWSEDKDISQDSVLDEIRAKAGLEHDAYFERIADPAIKARLKANTDEVIARGGFGTPTMFVGGDDMYFGNDRLPLVSAAIERRREGDAH